MENRSFALEGGFADPVLDPQSIFRAVMNAMAEPGTCQQVDGLANPPAPMTPASGAVALTLCDHDTSVWLDPDLNTVDIRAWIQFQTGAATIDDPAQASFAFIGNASAMPNLSEFGAGSQEYPDRSTTLVLQVTSLEGGSRLTLSGPGIAGEARLAPATLPRDFLSQWEENRAHFPRGVDMILVAPDAVACLPRTTRISMPLEA